MRWEDEVQLLKTELARAWSTLKLEEHRNRESAILKSADSLKAIISLPKRGIRINFLFRIE